MWYLKNETIVNVQRTFCQHRIIAETQVWDWAHVWMRSQLMHKKEWRTETTSMCLCCCVWLGVFYHINHRVIRSIHSTQPNPTHHAKIPAHHDYQHTIPLPHKHKHINYHEPSWKKYIYIKSSGRISTVPNRFPIFHFLPWLQFSISHLADATQFPQWALLYTFSYPKIIRWS